MAKQRSKNAALDDDTDRSFDADTADVNELSDVVATMVSGLQGFGLFG